MHRKELQKKKTYQGNRNAYPNEVGTIPDTAQNLKLSSCYIKMNGITDRPTLSV